MFKDGSGKALTRLKRPMTTQLMLQLPRVRQRIAHTTIQVPMRQPLITPPLALVLSLQTTRMVTGARQQGSLKAQLPKMW